MKTRIQPHPFEDPPRTDNEARPVRIDGAAVRELLACALDLGARGVTCWSIRPAVERRGQGATYTPRGIVRAMMDWAQSHATPERIVDAGLGSGRFLTEAGRRFPRASLVGVELDPVPALLARANLAVL